MTSPARPDRRHQAVAVAVMATLVLGGACSAPGSALPPRPPLVELTMREMSFDFDRNLPRGRVVFKLHNAGRRVHRAALVYLPKGVPPILDQLRGSERMVVDELASVPNRPPGSTDSFAVNLDPGRWAFVCFIIDPDGKSHAEKGMASEFTIR